MYKSARIFGVIIFIFGLILFLIGILQIFGISLLTIGLLNGNGGSILSLISIVSLAAGGKTILEAFLVMGFSQVIKMLADIADAKQGF